MIYKLVVNAIEIPDSEPETIYVKEEKILGFGGVTNGDEIDTTITLQGHKDEFHSISRRLISIQSV